MNWCCCVSFCVLLAASASANPVKATVEARVVASSVFPNQIKPLLSRYCYNCHGEKKQKGDLSLQAFQDEAAVLANRKIWEKVLHHLRTGEMPPENKPQPSRSEREMMAGWIESRALQCDCDHPDPGRVTLRRLNRAEYNNTIRDLVGVDFKPADDFPADDSGYGFDNIGDVLALPPILLEKYLAAAEKVLDAAILTDETANQPRQKFEAEKMHSTAKGGVYKGWALSLDREGEIARHVDFAEDGEYIFRARAFGQQAGPDPARMEFRLDYKPLKIVDVKAVESAPGIYQVRFKTKAGSHRIAAAYINNYLNPNDPDPENRDRNLLIDWVEIIGPIKAPPLSPAYKQIFISQPTPTTTNICARTIVNDFTRRAYRRPVAESDIDRLMKFFAMAQSDGESFEQSIKLTLQAVLVSPHFLFHEEVRPGAGEPKSVQPLDDFALASRLSYFIWSSLPDDELFVQASRGTLRKNLEGQVKRMLKNPKSSALVENFAGQWLQLRTLKTVTPDPDQFPTFDESLRAAMQKETELFFEDILRADDSVLNLLDAKYTFLNERMARHYGIAGIKGDEFRRVSLKDTPRGGILTHASVLTITSNPTRTSPVKRGKWILENILGTPPPPPPPEVPVLSETKEIVLSGSLRQRMEQHRANPKCASCHARMDPLGFGFENYDGVGAWRERDGKFPIDSSGNFFSGESFRNAGELKTILIKRKKDAFLRCISEKMLTYALGRGLEFYDTCAVDEISKKLAKQGGKFSSLVCAIARSAPFQRRRGDGNPIAQNSP